MNMVTWAPLKTRGKHRDWTRYSRLDLDMSDVGCIFSMSVVSMLPHAEFGQNDHREDATHCKNDQNIRKRKWP